MFYLTYDNGVPELYTRIKDDTRITRICGATMDPDKGVYRYPWFWPMCYNVLCDIDALWPNTEVIAENAMHEYLKQEGVVEKYKNREYPIELPEGFFKYDPYEHQRDGVILGTLTWRVGWLYQMGLGKTKMAVDAIRIRKLMAEQEGNTNTRYLVITPPPVIDGFRSEIDLHSKNTLSHAAFWGESAKNAVDSDATVIITTYDTLRLHPDRFADIPFFGVIADESHRFRNWSTKTAKKVLQLTSKIPWRVMMTGSPGVDPRHWFPQLKYLSDALILEGNYTQFQNRYLVKSRHQTYGIEGYKNMDALQRRISTVCLRKKVEDCLDLPPRTVVHIEVPVTKKVAEVYNGLFDEGEAKVNGNLVKLPYTSIITQIQSLLQVSRGWMNESQKDPEICDGCEHLRTCVDRDIKPYTKNCQVVQEAPPNIVHTIDEKNPLIDRVVNHIHDILEGDSASKVLVWFRSNETLRRCMRSFVELREKAIDNYEANEHVVFTSGAKYGKVVERIQNDPKVRVCFGQIKCGIGVTMTAAQYTIYVEFSMSTDEMQQSGARNYRPGQDKPVFEYHYSAKNTIDNDISKLVSQKESIEELLQGGDVCSKCEELGYCVLGLRKKESFCGTSKSEDKSETCRMHKMIRRSKIKISRVDEYFDDDGLGESDTETEGEDNGEEFVYDMSRTAIF